MNPDQAQQDGPLDVPAVIEADDESVAEAPAHAEESTEAPTVPESTPDASAPKKPHGNTSGKDAIVIRALIRDTEAVRMRANGNSYPAIAAKLGYGHRGNAQRAVQRRLKGMREDCAEAVAEVRQLEGMRLDIALSALMTKVREGDLQAIDRLLRIQERRAAYEGLDQPRGLKVEMARELEGFLGRLREEFDDDVFERVLALIAGEHGSSAPMGAPIDQAGQDGEAEGGGDEEPPTPTPRV